MSDFHKLRHRASSFKHTTRGTRTNHAPATHGTTPVSAAPRRFHSNAGLLLPGWLRLYVCSSRHGRLTRLRPRRGRRSCDAPWALPGLATLASQKLSKVGCVTTPDMVRLGTVHVINRRSDAAAAAARAPRARGPRRCTPSMGCADVRRRGRPRSHERATLRRCCTGRGRALIGDSVCMYYVIERK